MYEMFLYFPNIDATLGIEPRLPESKSDVITIIPHGNKYQVWESNP